MVEERLDRRSDRAVEVGDLLGDLEIERVRARPAPIADDEDPFPSLRRVEDVGEADQGRAGVGVADVRGHEAKAHLRFGEPELLADPLRELSVRLVEDHVGVVLGGRLRAVHDAARALGDVAEVGGFACEPAGVARVALALPTPEIRRVGRVGERVQDLRDDLLTPDHERGAAGARRVFERIPRGALARVGRRWRRRSGSSRLRPGRGTSGSRRSPPCTRTRNPRP